MRPLAFLALLAGLSACAEESKRATFTCPNGPTLAVRYEGETATIFFPNGRVETLSQTDSPEIYAKPGTVWQLAGFRTARLTDGQTSFSCDQMAG